MHRITAINDAARYWLAPEQSHSTLIGKPLTEFSQGLANLILDSLSNRPIHSITLGRHEFAVSLYPLNQNSDSSGYLMMLNHEQDMSALEQELARTTAYANQLRAKTHEHNNKLNVISGLLQAGKPQEAIDYLQQESDLYQHMLGTLVRSIENSPVAGMLLSKYQLATEQQIDFLLDDDCHLKNYSQPINDDLISLIGNLIDNALYAAKANTLYHAQVHVFISDRTNYVMITVEDSGTGVDERIAERIFDLGISSKPDQTENGLGLYLVNRIVKRYNGSLDWERTDDQRTVFSVYLDKRELKQ